MNKIETLLKELCPNGITYGELNDVCEIIRGVRVTKKDLLPSGYPVVSGGTGYMGFIDKYNREPGTITIAQYGSAGYVNYQKERFWANDVCFSVYPNEKVLNKFLYHFLLNKQNYLYEISNRSAIPYSISKERILKIKIPIPPLEIQGEIVKILDKFTDYVTELNTELNLRQKQYNYYRDKLLSFEGEKVQHVKLSTVCQVYDGTHQTPRYRSEGVPFVSVENIKNLYKTSKYISIEDFEKYKIKPRINDILMTRIGDVGTCTVVDRDEDLAYYVSLALIRPNIECINPYFLRYFIESRHGRRELNRRILHTAVPIKINMGDIGKIMISLPSMEIQTQIVKILDNFNHLTSNISNGLPKEIELRQKQYEYYRDKLLSFD